MKEYLLKWNILITGEKSGNIKALLLCLAVLLLLSSACIKRVEQAPTIKEAEPAAVEKPSWKQEWDDTLMRAKKEGKLVVYLSTDNVLAKDPIIKAMSNNYGLELEIVVARPAEIIPRILAERKAGIFYFDIWVSGVGISVFKVLRPSGAVGDLKPNIILPEVKEEKNWRNGKIPWIDKEEKILSFGFVVFQSADINTSLVKKEEMSSYMDLLNPKWKGKILMNDPTTVGRAPAYLQVVDKIMGRDFLRQLVKQEPLLMRDGRLQVEWLSQGKYPIALGSIPSIVYDFKKAGAPIEFIIFKEGTGITSSASNLLIIDNSPHPKAAKIFINWLLSQEGQTLWSKSVTNTISQRIDISTEHIDPVFLPKPGIKLFDQTTEEAQLEFSDYMELAIEMFSAVLK